MARGKGGRRTPEHPAPVSGPGALSQRTDGQPVRSFPAQTQGQRQQLAELQQAAPLEAGGAGASSTPAPSASPAGMTGILGPTQRPNEPVGGLPPTPRRQVLDPDPDALLRAIYQMYPHPDIARFLSES